MIHLLYPFLDDLLTGCFESAAEDSSSTKQSLSHLRSSVTEINPYLAAMPSNLIFMLNYLPYVHKNTMTSVKISAYNEVRLSSKQAHSHKFYLASVSLSHIKENCFRMIFDKIMTDGSAAGKGGHHETEGNGAGRRPRPGTEDITDF